MTKDTGYTENYLHDRMAIPHLALEDFSVHTLEETLGWVLGGVVTRTGKPFDTYSMVSWLGIAPRPGQTYTLEHLRIRVELQAAILNKLWERLT
jgi:hypothetical protein